MQKKRHLKKWVKDAINTTIILSLLFLILWLYGAINNKIDTEARKQCLQVNDSNYCDYFINKANK